MVLLAIVLSVIGLLLVYAEFFYPGVLLGILGAFGVGFGVALFVWTKPGVLLSASYLVTTIVLLISVCKLAIWQMKRKRVFFPDDNQEGFTASFLDHSLIGKAAYADTDLRPSGYILLDDMRLPALSEGNFVPKGTPVKIIKGKGNYYVITRGKL